MSFFRIKGPYDGGDDVSTDELADISIQQCSYSVYNGYMEEDTERGVR